MEMASFKVRAVTGRIARTAPDGDMIPHDRFIAVEITAYTRRLLEVHKDIELPPATKPTTKSKPAPKPAAEVVTKPTTDDSGETTEKTAKAE